MIGAGDQAVGGAELVVHVANTTDTGTDLTPMAEGVTDDTGSFELHGALGEAPYSLNPDGSVQLEIMVTDPAADTIRFVLLNALPPAENRPDWTFNQTPDPAVLPEPAAAQASERAYGVISGLSLPMTGDGSVEYNASANDAVGASADETSEALAEDNTQPYSDDGVPAHSGVGDGASLT